MPSIDIQIVFEWCTLYTKMYTYDDEIDEDDDNTEQILTFSKNFNIHIYY